MDGEVAAARTVPNGTREAPFDTLNSLVHKLLHACEVVPIGRAHLFHLRTALKAAKSNQGRMAYLGAKAVKELAWWASQLDNAEACESHGVPFASRLDFPTSGDDTVIQYSDASRETDEPAASGFGAWAVIAGVFVFVEGRWTAQEVKRYSINVLEAWARDTPARCFLIYARSVGLRPTHSLAYVDNSTAFDDGFAADAAADGAAGAGAAGAGAASVPPVIFTMIASTGPKKTRPALVIPSLDFVFHQSEFHPPTGILF